jgi:hypothetical protein
LSHNKVKNKTIFITKNKIVIYVSVNHIRKQHNYELHISHEVNEKTKIAVYKAIYTPTLTYSCESWTLLDTHRSKIQALEMRFLRRVEKVTKRDRIRNQVIREQLQVEPLQERIERTTAGGTITGAY